MTSHLEGVGGEDKVVDEDGEEDSDNDEPEDDDWDRNMSLCGLSP